MSVFSYFLPGLDKTHVTPALIASRGLGDVLADCARTPAEIEQRLTVSNVARGPSGSSGAIIVPMPVDGSSPERIGYFADRQEWYEISDVETPYWLGVDTQQRPSASTLQRQTPMSGYEIELGDGQIWSCPTLRRPNGATNLPRAWGVDGKGLFAERVLAEYEAAWEMAGEIWNFSIGVTEIERPEAFDYAVRCLAINYRVGPHEVSLLQLLTSENYHQVTGAAVDAPLIEELLRETSEFIPDDEEQVKKNDVPAPDSANSTPSPPDASETTDLPVENSTS